MKSLKQFKLISFTNNVFKKYKQIMYIFGKKGLIKLNFSNYKNITCLPTLKKKIQQSLVGTTVENIKRIIFKGVGYRVEKVNNTLLSLKLGYSHTLYINIPSEIETFLPKRHILVCKSFKIDLVSLFVMQIKKLKKFNIYKGKGIFLKNQIFKLKEGKKKK
jgi:large subunit ribosomal protein L6